MTFYIFELLHTFRARQRNKWMQWRHKFSYGKSELHFFSKTVWRHYWRIQS